MADDWGRIEGDVAGIRDEADDEETLEAGGAAEGVSGALPDQDEAHDVWDATEEPGATAGVGAWRDESDQAGETGEGASGDVKDTGGVWDEAKDMSGEGTEEFRERT